VLPGAGYCQVVCLGTEAGRDRFTELNDRALSAARISLFAGLLVADDFLPLEEWESLFDGRLAMQTTDPQLQMLVSYGSFNFAAIARVRDGKLALPVDWQDQASSFGDYDVCFEQSDL